MKIEQMSFEEAYNRLAETAAELEKGNLTLEQSLALYEEGVALARHCETLLDKAELKVSQLTPGRPSTPEEESFDLDDDDDFV